MPSKTAVVHAKPWVFGCWLRHGGATRRFRRIPEARAYAASVGKDIWIKWKG